MTMVYRCEERLADERETRGESPFRLVGDVKRFRSIPLVHIELSAAGRSCWPKIAGKMA